MEDKSITNKLVATVPVAITTNKNHQNNPSNGSGKNKKKKGAFGILKAAMLMLRSRKSKKTLQLEVAKNENWKKIVGSMRPLHLQDHPPLSPPPPVGAVAALHSVQSFDNFEDVFPPPCSPAHSTVSVGSTSQYASAKNLQELDKSEDEEDRDAMFDDKAGDVTIDAKAEEFIAQFYEQMRLQNNGSATREMRRA